MDVLNHFCVTETSCGSPRIVSGVKLVFGFLGFTPAMVCICQFCRGVCVCSNAGSEVLLVIKHYSG